MRAFARAEEVFAGSDAIVVDLSPSSDAWADDAVGRWLGQPLAEALVLWLAWRRHRRGLAPAAWATNLASGLCLMLALRAALAGWSGAWILACLAASGLVHAADLWHRWR